MKYYKVIFGDIYTLTCRCLPLLDIVTLFHLCEFYVPEEISFVHHNDESLLELFLDRLNFGGKILFFTKSIGWEKASFVVQAFEKQGKIEKVEEYKSLLVYSKKTGSERHCSADSEIAIDRADDRFYPTGPDFLLLRGAHHVRTG